jgi:hypothetical protein
MAVAAYGILIGDDVREEDDVNDTKIQIVLER